MALSEKAITSTWQAITTAGQSGTCWIPEYNSDRDAIGAADVVVYHTDAGAPTGDNALNLSKKVFKPESNINILQIPADNGSDIYYARCRSADAESKLIVDVS